MNIHKQEAKVLRKENTKMMKELEFYKEQFEKEDNENDLVIKIEARYKILKKDYDNLKIDKDEERLRLDLERTAEVDKLEASLSSEQQKSKRLEQELKMKNDQFEQMLTTIGVMNSINTNTNVNKRVSYEGEPTKK